MEELAQKLPEWLNWENVQDAVMILTFIVPFVPAKYMKYLGPFLKFIKAITANFYHAESVDEKQYEENRKNRNELRRKR